MALNWYFVGFDEIAEEAAVVGLVAVQAMVITGGCVVVSADARR